MYRANIYVSLKKTVADPQGKTIQNALNALGWTNIEQVRMGKYIEITLKATNNDEAKRETDEMAKKLLVNQIIEDYSFELKEV